MKKNNRRRAKRLKIDHSVKVPVQISPILPFIGKTFEAESINISAGGMALKVDMGPAQDKGKKGTQIKIFFRLPGHPLQECKGKITHQFELDSKETMIGIKFTKASAKIVELLNHMAMDDEACDQRIKQEATPWCLPVCSFHCLCRKPLRTPTLDTKQLEKFEIALQLAQEMPSEIAL